MVQPILLSSLKFIESHLEDPLTAEAVAQHAGYSVYYFTRLFKQHMGLPIMEYVQERRLIKASEAILEGARVFDAALMVGYQSHSGFTKAFKNKFGFSPQLLRAYHWQKQSLSDALSLPHIFMKPSPSHMPIRELYSMLLQSLFESPLPYNLSKIEKAYNYAANAHAHQLWRSGDPYLIHPLSVALLLAELDAGEDLILAGLLHDVLFKDAAGSLPALQKTFSKRIVKLIEDGMTVSAHTHLQDESLTLLKICDRLHNMRTLEYADPDRRKAKAEQTLDLYAPAAAKVNDERLIAELTDLSMKYV